MRYRRRLSKVSWHHLLLWGFFSSSQSCTYLEERILRPGLNACIIDLLDPGERCEPLLAVALCWKGSAAGLLEFDLYIHSHFTKDVPEPLGNILVQRIHVTHSFLFVVTILFGKMIERMSVSFGECPMYASCLATICSLLLL